MSVRYKTEQVTVVDKVLCDMCGRVCTKEHAKLAADFRCNINNNSKSFFIHMCEKCFVLTLNWIKEQRNPCIYTEKNDPLKGITT